MFSDLIKAMKAPATKKPEPSEERLNELLSQLFGRETDASDEEEAPAPAPAKKGGYMDKGSLSYFEGHGAREALDKAAEIEIELEGDESESEGDEEESADGEQMDKGAQMEEGSDKGSKEKRRELMSAAYSMIDNLSDDQLEEFLSAREVKKAQVMAVIGQMSDAEIGELVSAAEAQGARAVDAEKV